MRRRPLFRPRRFPDQGCSDACGTEDIPPHVVELTVLHGIQDDVLLSVHDSDRLGDSQRRTAVDEADLDYGDY